MPRGVPKTGRRRRRRRSTQSGGSNGAASSVLSQITALVAENEQLTRQNRALQASLETISRAVQNVRPGGAPRRRGRPPVAAAASSSRPVGRPRARRRRPMSPETLARRRAGLAKARAVLAAKRAAAKRKS